MLSPVFSIPARSLTSVREGNAPVSRTPGITIDTVANGIVVLNAWSGSYRFTARLE
jgi:hypothetical protein